MKIYTIVDNKDIKMGGKSKQVASLKRKLEEEREKVERLARGLFGKLVTVQDSTLSTDRN